MAAAESIPFQDFYRTANTPVPIRFLRTIARFVRTKPLGAFGALILIIVVLVGVFSPWLASDPNTVHLSDALTGPGSKYWFGTDHNGRDVYSRIVYGCQITAMVGLGTVILVTVLSLLVGL